MVATLDVMEERLDHIVRQVDNLVRLSEARDARISDMCNRLTIMEERQGTMTRLMVAMSAAIPTVILGVGKLVGIV